MSDRIVPPRRGWGLGLRLGLLTTLVVTGVMGVVSGTQLAGELRAELRERRARLGESLAPLVSDLQSAVTREDVRVAVERFHASYVAQGHAYHNLVVVDSSGRIAIDTRDEGRHGARDLLTAAVPLVSPAFGPQLVELHITEDSFDFSAERARRWRDWAIHVGVTALLILVLLFFVIRREVTGPIERLLGGVRKMEMGYWDDMPNPGGAWEVRWLGWRFGALGLELSRTVEHLVAAQRRAYAAERDTHTESATPEPGDSPRPQSPDSQRSAEAIAWLRAQLERLRSADPGDSATRALAESILDRHATAAERLGLSELRVSLEDAALRVLDPDEFLAISRRIEAERPRLDALAQARETQIRRALALQGVPVVEISHRVKHPAGTLKKMHAKNLTFEQVHDLVALRILVPTETDCYHALRVVHDLHVPIAGRFKDYIAQPKTNGYRGLHANVRDTSGAPFEVQIRSLAMHRHAEQGPAAYADYKHATRIEANQWRVEPWKRVLALFGHSRRHRANEGDAS